MAQKVSKMPGNRGIPGKHTLEIVAFQEGDPAYQIALPNGGTAPGGVSVATLQERFGDQTATVRGPEGDTYEISLTPWANQDAQKTLLQMTYRFTPLYPVKADPALRPSPFLAPKPSAQEASPAPTPAPHLQAHPSSTFFRPRSFFMGQHFASGHSVKITPTTNESGLTVQDLLARPEISQDEIACPLCGTKIPVHANFEEYVTQASQHSPVEISRVYINIAHPSNTPESQTPPADYPFHIDRIWRYDPISEPSTTPDEETELSMGVKSHDHIITMPFGGAPASSVPGRVGAGVVWSRVGTLASPFGEASLAPGFWWNRVQDTTLTILPFSCYYSNHYSGY